MCHSKLVTMKHFVSSQSQCIEHVQKLHVHWFDGYGYWPCAVPIEGKDRYSWMHCSIHGREIKPWCKFFALCGGQQTNLLCHSPNFFVFQTYGYSLRIHRFTNMSIIYVHLTNMSDILQTASFPDTRIFPVLVVPRVANLMMLCTLFADWPLEEGL